MLKVVFLVYTVLKDEGVSYSDYRLCVEHTLRPDFTSQLELSLTSSCFILS